MSRFIETICFEKGRYSLLQLHQERLNRAFAAHYPGRAPHNLDVILPKLNFKEKYKVRVVYDADDTEVEFAAYVPRQVKTIKLVEDNRIDYSHKYEDRSELKMLFDQRGNADEILIIKNGMVTDSFFANPVFWDGENWYVPKTHLLNGIRRQHLLYTGKVMEIAISKKDVFSFERVSLVNALVELGEMVIAPGHILKTNG